MADLTHRCDPTDLQEIRIPEVPPLTREQKELIKSTAPILTEQGVVITTHFCMCSLSQIRSFGTDAADKDMIRAHPELRDVFSHSGQKVCSHHYDQSAMTSVLF